MFQRANFTYDLDPNVIGYIQKDEANPLNRIFHLIPEGSKVLDIGAGNGLLAMMFKESNKKVVIDGIEPDSYAVNVAKQYYRDLYCGFAQDFKEKIVQENYDFIILADVIEHMQDPLAFLNDLCFGLPEKTRVVFSIPNVAFGAVRISLLNGNFDYVDSGLLEKTHIRFFTLKTILELVAKNNMNIEKLFYLQRDIFNSEIRLDRSNVNLMCLRQILQDDLSSTYQFLLVLTKTKINTEKSYYGHSAKWSLFSEIVHRLWFK